LHQTPCMASGGMYPFRASIKRVGINQSSARSSEAHKHAITMGLIGREEIPEIKRLMGRYGRVEKILTGIVKLEGNWLAMRSGI